MPEEDRPSRPQGSCDTVCEPGSGRTRGHTLTPVCEQKPGVVSHLFTALLLRPRSPLSTLITQGPPPPALTAGSTHSLAHSLSANYSSPEPGLLGKKAEPLPHQSVLAPFRHHSAPSPLFSWQLLSKPLQMPVHQALSVQKGLLMVG